MVNVPFGHLSAEEFQKNYGGQLEDRLRGLSDNQIKVEKIETTYEGGEARFKVLFGWGVDQKAATKAAETAVFALSAQFSDEIRSGMSVWNWSENSGFLAVSFYSPNRSLDELYDLLEPTLGPGLAKVADADRPGLWNPSKKEVQIEIRPVALATLQIQLRDVIGAVQAAVRSHNGGSLTLNTDKLKILMPRMALSLEDLKRVPIATGSTRTVTLNDVAEVNLVPASKHSRIFKTSGAPSLILFAQPTPGGNIKRMAEAILAIVEQAKPNWPKDIQFKVLVDPSEFIRSSIRNVFHEVVLAAILAVIILFLFVGSVRNVATAAIEIPLSIVLAFILMRLNGIYINIISLGGLALSAGMNVDASVVVMENIFRHFEGRKGQLQFKERLEIITAAVKEVRLPVIASTIASVVVFLPLAMTSNLSYAILGDLAKTVVFSHSFSALVALILVPTIRLQLMGREKGASQHSPLEKQLRWLEQKYGQWLSLFLKRPRVQLSVYGGVIALLIILVVAVLPRLPKEVIGTPDTDWMVLVVNTQGNTLIRQMDTHSEEIEGQVLHKFGDKIDYTFTQVQQPNQAQIMMRLRNKADMNDMWAALQKEFQNTAFLNFFVTPWNPSELPIPDPPQFQVSILGGTPQDRLDVSRDVRQVVERQRLFSRVSQRPPQRVPPVLTIKPHLDQWSGPARNFVAPADLAELARVATDGRFVETWTQDNRGYDIVARFAQGTVTTPEDLAALPIGMNNKLIPLKALADVSLEQGEPMNFRINSQDLTLITARMDENEKHLGAAARAKVEAAVRQWQSENSGKTRSAVQIDDAQIELTEALHQLGWAIALSVLLIFVTMVIQLGDVGSSLLVLVAVPLGFIGVLISLFAFGSTLSLNSALGVILLNGLAVANSIILVDFLNRLVEGGLTPEEAAVKAAQTRLRPILMTSLCTAMGMLPIALGLGEGGRILQPLGITVSGGLWFSMVFTLFLVPGLQVHYLKWRLHKKAKATAGEVLLAGET